MSSRRSLLAAFVLCAALGGMAHAAPEPVRVGVTRGTHAEIMDEVQRVARARGLTLDVVVFGDAAQIDGALAAGRIDVASFEDEQCVAAARSVHGYAIAPIAPTVTLPMALYSPKLLGLNQLRPGATIAIPDDAYGMARALILLQNYTLVTLRESAGLHATTADITGNRLHLKIVSLPHARLAHALNTAAFVAMESDDAARAGLQPARDSIGIEDARSPYADVLAVREADRTQPWARELVAAYHSDAVAHFILTRYQDSVRRPW